MLAFHNILGQVTSILFRYLYLKWEQTNNDTSYSILFEFHRDVNGREENVCFIYRSVYIVQSK